ncbi:MAG TPA: hypothetical protein VEM95_07365 [Thermoplasmata archaeon]|nr:hypothetical protein [Thermoplasmata archaeon]
MSGQIRKMKLKLCLVGERAVGKTSLIQRYVFNTFDEAYRGTLGSKLYLLSFSKHVAAGQIVEAQVALFDLMGEHAPRDAFRDAMFWGAHGFLCVADLSRPPTLYQTPAWVEAVRIVAGDLPYALLLNKADLARGVIGPQETKWLLGAFPNVPYSLTSAKTGEGVADAFESLLERVVDRILTRARQRQQMNQIASRILGFAQKRGAIGVTKNELMMSFKGSDLNALNGEIEALERLGYIVREDIGPASYRLLLTPTGQGALAATSEFVVEEPT